MKNTHKIAQTKATGHASINKRMSHSNAKIGLDAIVSVFPSAHAGHYADVGLNCTYPMS